MRLYAAFAAFSFMCVYAFRDWYRAALFLVLTMAVVERPDFPKQILGIPGMNPWNVLLLCTVMAFMISKPEDRPPIGGGIKFLIFFYLGVIVIAFLREFNDMTGLIEFAEYLGAEPIGKMGLIIDDLINTLKYVAPGVLVYLGCNSYERVREAIWAVILMNCMLAALAVKSMGFDALGSGTELEQTAIRRLDRDTGYFRSDLAILFAGSSWAIFAYSRFVLNIPFRWLLFAGSILCAMAIGLSGGRMGMAAWGVLGFVFGVIRWPRILLIGPLIALAIFATVPAVQERLLQGFDGEDEKHASVEDYGLAPSDSDVNLNSVTSGRVIIWPHVLEKIGESPFLGYGRRAMQRIGLSMQMAVDYDKPFAHPHNAYLQLFLDNGLLLGFPVLLFHLLVLKYSIQMTRDKSQPIFPLVGSISLAFSLSFLVGSFAQQSFYPFISSVSMWVAIALMLRIRAEQRALVRSEASAATPAFRFAANAVSKVRERQGSGYESWLVARST
ncbi:MAG: O-antigen ligase family protein [Pseudomonadota bacterium]